MITPSFGLTATERVLPKLALDFTTASLDPRITFTRALNTATVTNSSGYVVGVNADLPRFDFNPITLVCRGLLIEEARTNLVRYSDQFNDAYWTKARSTIGQDAIISPDGTQNADKLIEDTTVNATHLTVSTSITVANTTAHTATVYAKAGERTQLALSFDSGTANYSYFNLSTGAVITSGSSVTTSISNAGNGWYRCSVTFTTTGTGFFVRIANAVGGSATYTGDGTSGIYIWGAQLEAGAFATSYIPTTTTSLTRNADLAAMTGTNFSDWFNASEGTFAAEFIYTGFNTANFIYCVNTLFATTNYLAAYISAATTMRLDVLNAGTQARFASTVAPNTRVNTSFAYKLDNFAGAFNGGATQTDTSGIVATGDLFGIGNRNYVNVFNGWIQKLNYYPQRLTNNEVQAFSK